MCGNGATASCSADAMAADTAASRAGRSGSASMMRSASCAAMVAYAGSDAEKQYPEPERTWCDTIGAEPAQKPPTEPSECSSEPT